MPLKSPFEINWPLTCFSFSVEFVIYEILWCSKKSPFESFFPLENSSAFSSSACFSFKPRTSILRPNVLSYYNQSVQQKFKTLYKYFNESQNFSDLTCDAIAWNIRTAFPEDCRTIMHNLKVMGFRKAVLLEVLSIELLFYAQTYFRTTISWCDRN